MLNSLILFVLLTATVFAEDCVRIRESANAAGRSINIVFVPSGFGDELDHFEEQVREHWQGVSNYAPFSDDVRNLNVWVVKRSSSSYCEFKSKNERVLSCSGPRALAHATSCVPSSKNRQIVVIHNSPVHGGSGGSIASATTTARSPQVIVHEIGHSLFGLADEYTVDGHANGPNCSSKKADCSAWRDLIDAGLATCEAGCPGNTKLTNASNIMRALHEPSFGAVNERLICCKFKKMTGAYPGFCEPYTNIGKGLDAFCK